ncbi:penicillin-binding protein, partial [Lactobacillus crispatus]|nr:penicillin-binding protein [Lactobacillus crispatus]
SSSFCMCFFVQTNHTRKELLFLMFKEINLRNYSSLHKLFYSLLTTDNQNGIVMFLNQTYGSKNHIRAIGYNILKHIKANTFIKG